MGNTNGKNRVFNAKVKAGDTWEYRGTVVIRANHSSGVLYLRTGAKDEKGEALTQEIALFPKREAKEGALRPAPLPAPQAAQLTKPAAGQGPAAADQWRWRSNALDLIRHGIGTAVTPLGRS
jgi:hypothetical protein